MGKGQQFALEVRVSPNLYRFPEVPDVMNGRCWVNNDAHPSQHPARVKKTLEKFLKHYFVSSRQTTARDAAAKSAS